MPFTPFHFGPGILVGNLSKKKVHIAWFCALQGIIDLETASNMLDPNRTRLHTFFHTFLGVTVLVLVAGGLASLVKKHVAKFIAWWLPEKSQIVATGVVAGWSHVFLDGIYHADVWPFAPFTTANPFFDLVSDSHMMWGCLACAVMGGLIWLLRFSKHTRR
jgi:membrane-bound metal-dependent hydrolase YbcI (DUF457 family)